MTQLELREDTLTVHLTGIDRLLALRRRLDIPFGNLVNVDVAAGGERGLRAIEARLPAAIAPRTFYQQSGREAGGRLVIETYGQRYDRLVLEVEDARATASAITQAVRAA